MVINNTLFTTDYIVDILLVCCGFTGFLIDFIPFPVINGFTSAAAITIALGQVKVLLHIV